MAEKTDSTPPDAAAVTVPSPAPDDAAPAPTTRADAKAETKPDPEPEKSALPDGHVEVIVVTPISGLRNGEPWPAAGEPIVLPEAEARGYLQFGYVKLPDTE